MRKQKKKKHGKKSEKHLNKNHVYERDVEPAKEDIDEKKDKVLLVTLTKEPVQLARIHYDLFDNVKIQKIFAKLRCMAYDQKQDRWLWLYDSEARTLKFQASYSEIPKKRRPLVLGSFFSKTDIS